MLSPFFVSTVTPSSFTNTGTPAKNSFPKSAIAICNGLIATVSSAILSLKTAILFSTSLCCGLEAVTALLRSSVAFCKAVTAAVTAFLSDASIVFPDFSSANFIFANSN